MGKPSSSHSASQGPCRSHPCRSRDRDRTPRGHHSGATSSRATASIRGPDLSSRTPVMTILHPKALRILGESPASSALGAVKPPHLAHTGCVCFEKNCKTSKQNVERAVLICKLGAEEEPSHIKANYLLTRFWLRCFSWHLRHRSYFEGLFASGGAEQTAIPFPFGSKHPFAV